MSDPRRVTTVLRRHLKPHLKRLPAPARERLHAAVADALTGAEAVAPQTVPHPYVHGPAGCRARIGDLTCGLTRDGQAHRWPFGEPAPVPGQQPGTERRWHTLLWHIRNPAAPARAFDDINPVTARSWDREDWGTTGEDVVTLWYGRFQVFYGGWDAGRVAAAWRADRDRLAGAGGFAPLPFGPSGVPGEDLAEPPHECGPDCDPDYC
ncbi:hypothetical protein GCM10017673_37850 [Streptosporangium violaceochromogenes]|nr:hypothetical protein GCM10017673_37850 [Streptosporangium violaceochromogenes]